MALGILAGAFLFTRGGWFSVCLCAFTVSLLSTIDSLWGTELGRALADLAKAIIQ